MKDKEDMKIKMKDKEDNNDSATVDINMFANCLK